MTTHPIKQIVIRPNSTGTGWVIIVNDARGNSYPSEPIIDPTILIAETARIAAKLVLGRET